MEDIILKIEAENPEDIIDLQEYMLAKYPDLMFTENYKHQPGVNKEPIITAVIIALGGKKILENVQRMLKDYWDYKLKVQKETNRHLEEMYNLSIKSNTKNYSAISGKDFMDMHLN